MSAETSISRGFELREPVNPGAKVVLVDQDNVLADFEGEFLRRWQAKYPDYPFVSLEDRRAFNIADDYPGELQELARLIHNSAGFIASLPPIPGALNAIRQMKEAGHIVKICTSPLVRNVDSMSEKHDWVLRHLGRDWVRNLVISTDKTFIAGDYLIDDKPEITGLIVPTWKHVVYDTPYNQQSLATLRMVGWSNWRDFIPTPE